MRCRKRRRGTMPRDAPKEARWVHSTAMTVEASSSLTGLTWSGSGLRLQGRGGTGTLPLAPPQPNRVFIPIPTPVFVDSERLRLARVFVFFATENQAKVTSLAIFDGANQLQTPMATNNLNISGDHLVADAQNNWDF